MKYGYGNNLRGRGHQKRPDKNIFLYRQLIIKQDIGQGVKKHAQAEEPSQEDDLGAGAPGQDI